MKISIVYVSKSGNTEKTGEMIRDGILSVDPAIEVKLMNIIDEANLDRAFIGESSAVIFGTPTYVAGGCWQIKKLMDTVFDIPFAGKLAGCYATANFVHSKLLQLRYLRDVRLSHGPVSQKGQRPSEG